MKNLNSQELKRIGYIYASGYGPNSDFTLAEWFEARELYHKHKEKILMTIGEYKSKKN